MTSVALRVGDRIRFGKVEARFEGEKEQVAPPLPALAGAEPRPARVSVRPADFTNASPFPKRNREKDPVRTALFAAAAAGIVALLGSLLALAHMRPPAIP